MIMEPYLKEFEKGDLENSGNCMKMHFRCAKESLSR